MARVYQHNELLRLRQSPLVPLRPLSLPPIEDWMGTQDASNSTSKTAKAVGRAKHEEFLEEPSRDGYRTGIDHRMRQHGGANKSMALVDGIYTGPNDVLNEKALLPPKFEAAHRGNDLKQHKSKPGYETQESIRGRGGSWDQSRALRNPAVPQKSELLSKTGSLNTETGDEELWHRGAKLIEDARRDRNLDGTRPSSDRKNFPLRSREVASWNRQDSPGPQANAFPDKHSTKDPRYRNKRLDNAQDRGWTRTGSPDADPAWAREDLPGAGTAPVASQEDFELWRARQKAEKESRTSAEAPRTTASNHAGLQEQGDAEAFGSRKRIAQLDLGSDDKFFDLLGGSKNSTLHVTQENDRQDVAKTAAQIARSSKFSSMFNSANVKPQNVSEKSASAPSNDGFSEDQIGFQRILNLLGQQPPVLNSTGLSMAPLGISDMKSGAVPDEVEGVRNGNDMTLSESPSRSSQIPKAGPRPSDGEFLLNLMKTSRPAESQSKHHSTGEDEQRRRPEFNKHHEPQSNHTQIHHTRTPSQASMNQPQGGPSALTGAQMHNVRVSQDFPQAMYENMMAAQSSSSTSVPPGLERPPLGSTLSLNLSNFYPPSSRQTDLGPPPGYPHVQRATPSTAERNMVGEPLTSMRHPPPGFAGLNGFPPPGFPPPGFTTPRAMHGGRDSGHGHMLQKGQPQR